MKKRVFTFLLAGLIGFSTFTSSLNTVTVQAAELDVITSVIQPLPMPKESDYINTPSERKFRLAKEAIEFIIKHKYQAADVIERVSGKTVAKNFLKYFDEVADALEPLLDWLDVPSQAIYDAVYRTLINSGVSSKVAANIALAIKEGLSWFI